MGIATINPEQTVLKKQDIDSKPLGISPLETKESLSRVLGIPLHRIGGGTSKEVFTNPSKTSVYSIIKTSEAPIWTQAIEQIRFYQQHAGNKAFQEIALPIKKILRDQEEI